MRFILLTDDRAPVTGSDVVDAKSVPVLLCEILVFLGVEGSKKRNTHHDGITISIL